MATAKFGREHALPLVSYFRYDLTYADIGDTIDLGILPEGAVVTDAMAIVTTAFNSATTATLEVGPSTNIDGFLDSVSVKTAGRIFDATTMNASTELTSASEVTLQMKLSETGTAATAGAVTVIVTFITQRK